MTSSILWFRGSGGGGDDIYAPFDDKLNPGVGVGVGMGWGGVGVWSGGGVIYMLHLITSSILWFGGWGDGGGVGVWRGGGGGGSDIYAPFDDKLNPAPAGEGTILEESHAVEEQRIVKVITQRKPKPNENQDNGKPGLVKVIPQGNPRKKEELLGFPLFTCQYHDWWT